VEKMQSSFKVIKDTKVVSQGSKKIITQYYPIQVSGNKEDSMVEVSPKENHELVIKKMLEDAAKQSEAIVSEALGKAQIIQQNAYEEAYNAGYEQGQQNGYNDGYEAAIVKSKEESQRIIDGAENTLKSALKEYENYFEEKKSEIINLSINIARHILKREVSNVNGIDEMIVEALENSRNAESIIIRTNSLYTDNIKARLYDWKERFAIKADVFVVADEQIDRGCAIIEKNNGKIRIDIDETLESIKDSIL
jgi:flagellar assembly protein FliH